MVAYIICLMYFQYLALKEFPNEGFPEMLFCSFGLQHQSIMKLTQLLYKA